jgi:hypothetical protein
MNALIELKFNLNDDARYQVISMFLRDRQYFITFQPCNGDKAGSVLEKAVPTHECEILLRELENVTVPIGCKDTVGRLGGFNELAINLSMNSCRLSWGATPPGWEPLADFANQFAFFVRRQFGGFYYA